MDVYLWLAFGFVLGVLLTRQVRVTLVTNPLAKDCRKLRGDLETLPGVVDVHDLRVWKDAKKSLELSVHLVVVKPNIGFIESVREVATFYGIEHVTVQLETPELREAEEHGHPRWHF